MQPDLSEQLSSVAALAEPVRRRLYVYVATQRGPVGRAAAAAAAGVPRTVAAFHLDRLVEAGRREQAQLFGRVKSSAPAKG